MLDRRTFLTKGALLSGLPFVSISPGKEDVERNRISSPTHVVSRIIPAYNEIYFISHRGVHLNQMVCGENSLEALFLAKRVGFECIEFDVRFTKDHKAVVIHDDTINRTLLDKRGEKLTSNIKVRDLTCDQLRSDYIIDTANPKSRSRVPDFNEYVQACSSAKVIPFVEVKETDLPIEVYKDLLDVLDRVVGKGNYVITSNNTFNDMIREMGYMDILVMGILYQSSFDHIHSLGNSIMAISAKRFDSDDFKNHVERAKALGLLTESHADTFTHYDLIDKNGIDIRSTDLLAPNVPTTAHLLFDFDLESDASILTTNGIVSNAVLKISDKQVAKLKFPTRSIFIYGAFIEFQLKGEVEIKFGDHQFNVKAEHLTRYRYQILAHKSDFEIELKSVVNTEVTALNIKIFKY